jgi:hypothetical protein
MLGLVLEGVDQGAETDRTQPDYGDDALNDLLSGGILERVECGKVACWEDVAHQDEVFVFDSRGRFDYCSVCVWDSDLDKALVFASNTFSLKFPPLFSH